MSAMAGFGQGCQGIETVAVIVDGSAEAMGDRAADDRPMDSQVKPKPDAGHDASLDSPILDAPVEACAIDASLESLPVPDAALGTSSVGACLDCAKAACNSQIETCNADCACKEALVDVIECVAGGATFLSCAALAATEPNALNLGVCIDESCPVACGIKTGTPEGGGYESGAEGGGESGTTLDAAHSG